MLPCSVSERVAGRARRALLRRIGLVFLAFIILSPSLAPAQDSKDSTSTPKKKVTTDEVVVDGNGIRIGSESRSTSPREPGTPGTPPVPGAPPTPDLPPAPDVDVDGTRHGGDVVRFGEHLTIDKDQTIAGDVVVVGGSIDVFGRVSGDVVAVGGEITVHDGAVVNGEAVCVGGPVHQEQGSEIRGEVVSVNLGGPFTGGHNFGVRHGKHASPFGFVGAFIALLVGLGILFGLACLIMVVFGLQVDRIAAAVTRDPFKSAGIGLITVVALPPLIFLVAVTVIGIPAAIVIALLWFLGNIFGLVAVSRVAGHRVAASLPVSRSPYITTGIGMLVISALFMIGIMLRKIGGVIPLPGWIFTTSGLLVLSAASVIGLGAVVSTRFGRREAAWQRPPPPHPSGPPPIPSEAAPPPPPPPPVSPPPLAPAPEARAGSTPGEVDQHRRWDPNYRDPGTPERESQT